MVGGGVTVNVWALDEAPPEFATTLKVPALPMSVAGTEAVTCVALTKMVSRGVPSHWSCVACTKPLPVAVRVKDSPVAVAVLGLMAVRVGVGGLIGNEIALEKIGPESTAIVAVPATA